MFGSAVGVLGRDEVRDGETAASIDTAIRNDSTSQREIVCNGRLRQRASVSRVSRIVALKIRSLALAGRASIAVSSAGGGWGLIVTPRVGGRPRWRDPRAC